MNKEQFKKLKAGDIVRHKAERSKAYIVHDNCGDRVTAVRVVDMTNPAEWDLAVECQREQPWLSVEEFQLEANEGECFIVLKDRVVMAYHNSIGDFLTYEDGSFCYVKADITKVKHIKYPEKPD